MSFKELREQLKKSGTIDLTKLTPDGSMPKETTQKLIDLIVDMDDFLKNVSVHKGAEYKIPVDYFDVVDFVLQNLPEGVEPTAFSEGSNKGKIIEASDEIGRAHV